MHEQDQSVRIDAQRRQRLLIENTFDFLQLREVVAATDGAQRRIKGARLLSIAV